MRHYYAEWGNFLGVDPANPLQGQQKDVSKAA